MGRKEANDHQKTMAAIITYNPVVKTLKKCIDSVLDQVDSVILFDNGSANFEEIKKTVSLSPKIFFQENAKNLGISKNLNVALEKADKIGAKWILSLDQDSICPVNMVHIFLNSYLNEANSKIALICPNIYYRNSPGFCCAESAGVSYVDFCITSGSLFSVDLAKKINGFDEAYFIDYVDNDFCFSLRKSGFQILRINSVYLSHCLDGLIIKKLFWHCFCLYDKPFIRQYYICRNSIYFAKKNLTGLRRIKSLLRIRIVCFLQIQEQKKKDRKKVAELRHIYRKASLDAKHSTMGECEDIN